MTATALRGTCETLGTTGAMAPRPRTTAHILVHGLEFYYNAVPVLRQIGLVVERGDMVALIGPNGAGKSTLLKCLTRALRPRRGVVLVGGSDASRLSARQIARRVGTVPQGQGVDFEFTVEEVVAMGRHPHLRPFSGPGPRDLEAVREAMRLAGVEPLAPRPVCALSGGELQRVAIARALAQEPEILLLDEPTSHLDIAYQVDVLEIVRRLNRERGVTVLAAMHDLNLAAQYFPRFVLLAGGRILAAGDAGRVLRPSLLREAYGIDVVLATHPLVGSPVVLPVPRSVASASPAAGARYQAPATPREGEDAGAGGARRRGEVTLITGGARSGKSAFAVQLASRSGKRVVYVATCVPADAEMEARVAAHRRSRPSSWTTREEPLYPGTVLESEDSPETCFIVDCLTLLVSNHLLRAAGGGAPDPPPDPEALVGQVHGEVARLASALEGLRGDCVLVTNEVGMGVVPEWPLGRAFRDVAGRVNQEFARLADRVYLMVSGIPVQIK